MKIPEGWLPMPVIPLGCGLVVVASGTFELEGATRGVLQFQALPDEVRSMDPPMDPEMALAAMDGLRMARPRCDITFETPAAIDTLIETLTKLKEHWIDAALGSQS